MNTQNSEAKNSVASVHLNAKQLLELCLADSEHRSCLAENGRTPNTHVLSDGKRGGRHGYRHHYCFKTPTVRNLQEDALVALTFRDSSGGVMSCAGVIVRCYRNWLLDDASGVVEIAVDCDKDLERQEIELKVHHEEPACDRLRELALPESTELNERLLERAFNPSTMILPGEARIPNPDPDVEMRLLVEEVTGKDVSFICGVQGTGAHLAILAACKLHHGTSGILITGPSIEMLDLVADRLVSQIPPREDAVPEVLRVGATVGGCRRNLAKRNDSELQKVPIVVANLSEVATNSAIPERRFEIVIVIDAEHATITQVVHAASLGDTKIIIQGYPYKPSSRQPMRHAGPPPEQVHDIFKLSGITDALQHGVNDQRLLVCPTWKHHGTTMEQAVSLAAYGGRLRSAPGHSESVREFLRTKLRLFNTSSYIRPPVDAATNGSPGTALSTLLVTAVSSKWPYKEDLEYPTSVAVFTPHGADQKISQGLQRDVPSRFGRRVPWGPFSSEVQEVVVDLHHPTLCDHDGNVTGADDDLRFITTACMTTESGATLVGHIPWMEGILPADAPYRRYLDACKKLGTVVEPYPPELLTPASDLNAPGLSFYTESDAAWRQLNQDGEAAKKGVMCNFPDFATSNFNAGHVALFQRTCMEQILVLPVDNATWWRRRTTQGYRVFGTRHGETAVFIDRELVWILGARLFARVRGPRTVHALAEYFGLKSLFASMTPK